MPAILLITLLFIISLLFLRRYYKKYSFIGLFILMAPIGRFYIDAGFALKPFLIVLLLYIFFELSRYVILQKNVPMKIGYLIKTNSVFYLFFLFIMLFFLSDVINGVSVDSIRVFILLIITFSGALIFYNEIKSREDLEKAIKSIFWTGFLLGVSGCFFYLIFLYYPDLIGKGHFSFVDQGGSIFEGVSYNPDRPWEPANLMGVEISGGLLGTVLIPFIMTVPAVFLKESTNRMKIFSAFVFIILLLNLVLTFSRTALIATTFSMFSLGYFLSKRSILHKFKYVFGVALILILLMPTFRELFYQYSELKGFASIRTEDAKYTTAGRYPILLLAIETFLENPLFGVGHNKFWQEITYNKLGDRKMAHNTYIDLLVEHGMLVIILYLGVLLSTLKRGIFVLHRLKRNDPLFTYLAFIMAGLVGMLVAFLGNNILVSFVFWLIITLILAFYKIMKIEESQKRAEGYA